MELTWADYVFTSTMIVQKHSFYEVVRRCNHFQRPVIAGGPHPTSYHEEIRQEADGVVSHFIGGEVEHIFQDFLTDLLQATAAEVYVGPRTQKTVQTDITQTPLPRYDLIRLEVYESITSVNLVDIPGMLDAFRSAVQRHLEEGFDPTYLRMLERID